jgi:hypothetical protein
MGRCLSKNSIIPFYENFKAENDDSKYFDV